MHSVAVGGIFDGNNRRPPIMCCTGRWRNTTDSVKTNDSDGTNMEWWRNGNATQCESTLSWQSTEPHKMDCVATRTSYWQAWKYIYLVTTGLQNAEWEPTLSQRTARFAVLLQLFTHVTRICERRERTLPRLHDVTWQKKKKKKSYSRYSPP
jgi:hypothetical protein